MSNWKGNNIKIYSWGKKQEKELETLYSKFSEPKLDKDTLSSAYMDSYTKKVMPQLEEIKEQLRTIYT